MQKEKKWGRGVLILELAALVALGAFTALIDPAFHYHKPLAGISYYIFDQRYQNTGIVRNFEYDAIVTGTSMTENFRPSEMVDLFGVNAVKVSYSGSSLREIGDNLRRAFEANDHIKMVVLGLDGTNLMDDKDLLRSDVPLPEYLYDKNPLNDVSYLLNKQILLKYTMRMLQQTYYRVGTTSFDDYSYWDGVYAYGPEPVLEYYKGPERAATEVAMDPETARTVRQNIQQNVARLAQENPDTEFYLYFSPYSAVYWATHLRAGTLDKQIEAYRIAAEELVQYENVHLYSFFTNYRWTEDLRLYRDYVHHNADINSQILKQFRNETYRLTRDNYLQHWQQLRDHYAEFDFESFAGGYGWPFE